MATPGTSWTFPAPSTRTSSTSCITCSTSPASLLASHHGFKKIILLNGHGSNMPNLDLVARRTNLETDAECVLCAWWQLLSVDKAFMPRWRQSKFPGGCAHACELETSLYLYLDGDNVRKDLIKSGDISFNNDNSPFNWVDLFGAGPATCISWTSSYSDTGVLGEAELATAEKGKEAYEEAVKQLCRYVQYFQPRPKDVRKDRHRKKPTMPIPWGQRPVQDKIGSTARTHSGTIMAAKILLTMRVPTHRNDGSKVGKREMQAILEAACSMHSKDSSLEGPFIWRPWVALDGEIYREATYKLEVLVNRRRAPEVRKMFKDIGKQFSGQPARDIHRRA